MSSTTFDGTAYLDAVTSDPDALGFMRGFPPPTNRVIRFEDDRCFEFPESRWSLSHIRELMPTVAVSRDPHQQRTLTASNNGHQEAIESLRFIDLTGQTLSWEQGLLGTYTDGIAIIHRGRLVYERYFGALRPHLPHLSFSLTKSYVATLAASLIYQDVLKENWTAQHLIPELKSSAYADATIRQLLDMEVGVGYSEDYADRQSAVWQYQWATGMRPRPQPYDGPPDLRALLPLLKKEGEHGQVFDYKTPNTEVLSWIMERLTGQPIAHYLSDQLWAPLGCEFDGNLIVDPSGVAVTGAGLSVTLRDLARFGELMCRHGAQGTSQLIPAAVIDGLIKGGEQTHFSATDYPLLPGYSYRNQWWVTHNALGAFEGRGIHGQRLHIAPRAELVIARLASHPVATSAANDLITLPLFAAVTELLCQERL
jgi:hypothetical protein